MKKLSMLFAALLLAGGGVMFTGCSDDDDNKEQTGEIKITTDPQSPITLDAGENKFQVNVTVTGVSTWSVAAASGQDWCTADKGNYQNRFYITTPANDTGEERSTTVTITAGDKTLPLTVTQPVGLQAVYGAYEDYAGTYALGYETTDGSTFDIVFTIATSNDMIAVPVDDQGNTVNCKSYTVTGWSYSDIGKLKPMRAIFEPSQDDPNVGVIGFLCEGFGDVTMDGTTYNDVQIRGVSAPDAQGSMTIWTAYEGSFFEGLLGVFFDTQHSGLLLLGLQMNETQGTETISYLYKEGQSVALINDRDLFPTAGAVAEPGNAPASMMTLKAGMQVQKLSIPSFTRFPVQANVSMLRSK